MKLGEAAPLFGTRANRKGRETLSDVFASEGHEIVVEVVALGHDDGRGNAEARATHLQPEGRALALVVAILRDEQAREAGRWNERAEAARRKRGRRERGCALQVCALQVCPLQGGAPRGGVGPGADQREHRLDPLTHQERG